MAAPLIEIIDVHKQFEQKTVLKRISMSIEEGATTVIVGKSGAGKSVLMKCIAGLVEPDGGSVLLDGVDLLQLRPRERRQRMMRISYMFQNNALFDSFTAFDNIALPLRENFKMSFSSIEEKVNALLTQLDLKDVGTKYPSELSGGMQKRVALARALITEPDIVLFDEPTAGLDPVRKNAVFEMIEQYQRMFNFTAVIVTHELPDALFVADSVAVLEAGEIAFEGPPLAFELSHSQLARTFLESDESLIKMVLAIQDIEEVEVRYKNAESLSGHWILLSIDSLKAIFQERGNVAAQAIFQWVFSALTEAPWFDASATYQIDRQQVLIWTNQEPNAEALSASIEQLLKKAYQKDKSTLDGADIPITVSCAVERINKDLAFADVLKRIQDNLKIAYSIKQKDSKETV